jgi:FtsP/CotA-like multicopper oxidase with cupredoxin domain
LEHTTAPDGTKEFNLTITEGNSRFFDGKNTPTLGYNGNLLGPTIRVRSNDRILVNLKNTLKEGTTLHWHGAHVPASMDGGPFQVIGPESTGTPVFPIKQPAATLWYHPHLMGTTAEQVYRGLAGLLLIDDEVSSSLPIPNEYGINDIPLITQEREFYDDGTFLYRPSRPDLMHGYFGNALLVNGSVEPVFTVRENILRFRILNGSNSTVLRYSFEDGTPFYQIATDGGFLTAPVHMQSLVLSPGERAEILVDFSSMNQGDTPIFQGETNGGRTYRILSLPVEELSDRGYEIPMKLTAPLEPVNTSGLPVRRFVLSSMGMGGSLTINGKHMDMNRVDEKIPEGQTEVWEIINQGMGMMNLPHNFHVHDIQFRIIDINGASVPDHLRGPKDTVLLWPGDRIKILVRFDDYLGKYMYHCHFLEHEDQGMMGVIEVVGSLQDS